MSIWVANGYSMPIRGAKVLIFLISTYIFPRKFIVSQRNLLLIAHIDASG